MDEWLDIVNEADEVIGRQLRSTAYAQGRHDFRVVNAFVVNSAGELWIPKRGPHKRLFPDAWDMSMGGHVESGEGYDATFSRETAEELNIDVAQAKWRLLGKLTPAVHGVSAYMHVYAIYTDETPAYNPDDFTEAVWMAPADILAAIQNGQPSKGDLPALVRYYMQAGV